jgi:hypothetical protein
VHLFNINPINPSLGNNLGKSSKENHKLTTIVVYAGRGLNLLKSIIVLSYHSASKTYDGVISK